MAARIAVIDRPYGLAIFSGTRSHQNVEDYFAPGQFKQLSDADAVTASSYESMHAGMTAGAAATDRGSPVTVTVLYQTRVVDNPFLPSNTIGVYAPGARTYLAQVRQGAGELSSVRATGEMKFVTPGMASAVKLADPAFVVVRTDDLSIRTDLSGGAQGGSAAAVREALARHVEKHPEDQGNLQMIPLHEAVAA